MVDNNKFVPEKIIWMLKDAYNYFFLITQETSYEYSNANYVKRKYADYAVNHFKNAFEALEYNEKIIIKNEFFSSSPKEWYLNYFSKNYYYSLRKKAYRNFINYLN